MQKKLLNTPESLVSDALKGTVKAHSHLKLIKGHNIVVRADIENVRKAKVAVLSGGGSGHEPAHALYVGKGMLSAAICGNVFTSPAVQAIVQAIFTTSHPKGPGCLLIVKNYTGDVLNFGLAAEIAKQNGYKVEMVVVGDDMALLEKNKKVGRRGLCGTVFIHKIAGSMAENDKTLDEIYHFISENVLTFIGTMGVSLGPCIVPGNKEPTFTLENDEIELGLGIHGEKGILKKKMENSDKIVENLFDFLFKDEQFKNAEVAVIVNNLGSTTGLEMYNVANKTIDHLREKELKIQRIYVGNFMTALEMPGISITLLKLKEKCSKEILSNLDSETISPIWPRNQNLLKAEGDIEIEGVFKAQQEKNEKFMKDEELNEDFKFFKKLLISMSKDAIKNKDILNELDSKCGDGDMGNNFSKGGELIEALVGKINFNNYSDVVYKISLEIQKIGGTSGVVFSYFLIKMSETLKNQDTITPEIWLEAFKNAIVSIEGFSGAKKGDRTFLDTIIPAVETLEKALKDKSELTFEIISQVVKAAENGANSTKDILPSKGRSTYLGDRVLGFEDPGSKAMLFLFQCWENEYKNFYK
eukprot:gene12342-6014_t